MKALVTGGAGFIGSNLTDALIAQNHEVIVLDNLSTGRRENVHPRARLVEADITNRQHLMPHFAGVDWVFHCAALPRVQLSIEDPVATNDANVNGTLNVLLSAREAKVKRVVYSASSSAYGNAATLPLQETMLPSPMSPYGLQKYVGEHYARLFSLLYGLPTVSLRYFNVYGPLMASSGAYLTFIAVFLQRKARGETLTIYGDGTQTRDFTFVGDVVAANLLAASSDTVGRGEVMNIGAGRNYSVNEIARRIGGVVEYLPPRVEPHDTLADTTIARELLGWEPAVTLEEGIQRTVQWFEQQHEAENQK